MNTKRKSIEEVEIVAATDDAYREAAQHDYVRQREEAAEEARYFGMSPSQLVAMWKSGCNLGGKPLSPSEFRSLCAAWFGVFDSMPPEDGSFGSAQGDCQAARASEPNVPADITIPEGMLSRHEVCDLMGFSVATLDRMVKQDRFPKPYQVSERRVMFQGVEVRAWWQGIEAKRARA